MTLAIFLCNGFTYLLCIKRDLIANPNFLISLFISGHVGLKKGLIILFIHFLSTLFAVALIYYVIPSSSIDVIDKSIMGYPFFEKIDLLKMFIYEIIVCVALAYGYYLLIVESKSNRLIGGLGYACLL